MTYRRDCEILSRRGQPIPAKFHRWGDSYFTDRANERHPLTVAIVERADGTVEMCSPDEIRFTGPADAHEAMKLAAEKWAEQRGSGED